MTQRLVRMPQAFDMAGFLSVLERLQRAASSCDVLVLDFSRTERAYPNGVTPLIATLMRLHESRPFETRIISPTKTYLRDVFKSVGWNRYLEADHEEFLKLPKVTRQFTPVRPFGRDELGVLHRSIMDVLLRQARLAESIPNAIDWALWEVMDNVLNHAEVKMGWVQASTFREKKHLNIVVADAGVGIRGSLSRRYPDEDEQDLMRRAIESGETRDPRRYKGYGLFGCRDIAIQGGGEMRLLSGAWKFVQEAGKTGARDPTAQSLRRYFPVRPRYPGTVVELMVRTDKKVDMARALGRTTPMESFVDLVHASREGIIIDIAGEASDLGTRVAGRGLRTKVLNLVGEDPAETVILDFSKVSMLSSSFADEFVAKLAMRVGRERFNSKFELRGLNPSVNTVVQIALFERIGAG
jgi:anti-sigma regulatory factor (Ser/Thr protein kinase)